MSDWEETKCEIETETETETETEKESSYYARSTSTITSSSSSSSSASASAAASASVSGQNSSSTPSTSARAHPAPAKFVEPPANARVESTAGFAQRHRGLAMRLYCRTGFCITVRPDGSVVGDACPDEATGVLEFTSAGIGEVRIRGVEANLYLAMNVKGMLYGEEDPGDYATVFVERTYNMYSTYLSQKYAHRGWYVGVKKSGAIKKAAQTKWGQKAIQFLPLTVETAAPR